MSIELKIILSAVAIVALVIVVWLVAMFKDGRKERERVREFKRGIARQERTLNVRLGNGPPIGKIIVSKELADDIAASAPPDDDTKTWPTLPPGAAA